MSQKTLIDLSHELKAAPELPELEAGHEYPELSSYENELAELNRLLEAHK